MRYLDELRAFHEYLLNNALSSGEIALWHALMGRNNRLGWLEEFSVTNLLAQQLTSLSRSGLDRARNRLKQRGLICYRPGKSGSAGHYHLVSVASLYGDIVDKAGDKPTDQCNIMDKAEDKLTDQCNIMDTSGDNNRAYQWEETAQPDGTLTRLRPRERLRLRQSSVVTATPFAEMASHDLVKRDMLAYVGAQLGDKGKVLSEEMDFFLSRGMTEEQIQDAVDIAKSKGKRWRYAKGVLTNQLNDGQAGKGGGTGKQDAGRPLHDERWRKGELY